MTKKTILASATMDACWLGAAVAHADTYPSKPITIVVPSAAAA